MTSTTSDDAEAAAWGAQLAAATAEVLGTLNISGGKRQQRGPLPQATARRAESGDATAAAATAPPAEEDEDPLPSVVSRLREKEEGLAYPSAYFRCMLEQSAASVAQTMMLTTTSARQRTLRVLVDQYLAMAEKKTHRSEKGYIFLTQLTVLVTSLKAVPQMHKMVVGPEKNRLLRLPGVTPELLVALGQKPPTDAGAYVRIPVLNMTPACKECGNAAVTRCTRCMAVFYCGVPCQKAHYKEHKSVCVKNPNASGT